MCGTECSTKSWDLTFFGIAVERYGSVSGSWLTRHRLENPYQLPWKSVGNTEVREKEPEKRLKESDKAKYLWI